MGISYSVFLPMSIDTFRNTHFRMIEKINVRARSVDFQSKEILTTVSLEEKGLEKNGESNCLDDVIIEESIPEVGELKLQTTVLLKKLVLNADKSDTEGKVGDLKNNVDSGISLSAVSEVDKAAIKLQKVYKSYRTRRNLADCAVIVEELWWKALDFTALKRSSVSFFNSDKSETVVSRWARARTRAAKVGKGLSKHEKAQKLALRHWLEAIDPRHRYGHNLHLYYDVWFVSESSQPFFYWLDIGEGKELDLKKCPRADLQRQCIKYLGPKEREAYEVTVESGKLVYRQSGMLLDSEENSKWIFVLSTTRSMYVGRKVKGLFQHSSFLAGGATAAAGRLVAHNGVLEAIWPYSGHYRPTEENFMEFISFLEEHQVDLTNVKKCAVDDDVPPSKAINDETESESVKVTLADTKSSNVAVAATANDCDEHNVTNIETKVEAAGFELGKHLSSKWTTGVGPRIGCVKEYPARLQVQALEQVNLSPRNKPMHSAINGPIPSPRPSPKVQLSPKLAYMGLPSPRLSFCTTNKT